MQDKTEAESVKYQTAETMLFLHAMRGIYKPTEVIWSSLLPQIHKPE